MKLPRPVRWALIGAILATLLNPLWLAAEAALVYGTGLLVPREFGSAFLAINENATTFVVLGTIVLIVPELACGLVFGAGFAAVGRGGRSAGVLWGTIFWSLFPLFYGGGRFALGLWVENEGIYMGAWLVKEMGTGLIIGYVIGRLTGRWRDEGRLPDAQRPDESHAAGQFSRGVGHDERRHPLSGHRR